MGQPKQDKSAYPEMEARYLSKEQNAPRSGHETEGNLSPNPTANSSVAAQPVNSIHRMSPSKLTPKEQQASFSTKVSVPTGKPTRDKEESSHLPRSARHSALIQLRHHHLSLSLSLSSFSFSSAGSRVLILLLLAPPLSVCAIINIFAEKEGKPQSGHALYTPQPDGDRHRPRLTPSRPRLERRGQRFRVAVPGPICQRTYVVGSRITHRPIHSKRWRSCHRRMRSLTCRACSRVGLRAQSTRATRWATPRGRAFDLTWIRLNRCRSSDLDRRTLRGSDAWLVRPGRPIEEIRW